jgi:hypothetical protein
MGRGWGGVSVNEAWCLSGDSTPTLPSPIKGEGSRANHTDTSPASSSAVTGGEHRKPW